MPQKTIWIPDELDESLKAFDKSERKINVSAVSQEALRREVNRLQAVSLDETELEPVIDRLRKEKVDYQAEWRERGKQLALEWTRSARYGSLVQQARTKITVETFNPARFVLEELGADTKDYDSYEWAVSEAQKMLPVFKELVYWDYDNIPQLRQCADSSFAEGWVQGFEAFWTKVKEAI